LGLVLALSQGPACRTTPSEGVKPEQHAAADASPPVQQVERSLPAGEQSPPAIALGTGGAVASAEAHATDVGLAVLQRGGNAVDAAVAVGFALAVTHPSAGNLGGGGFMVIRMADGRTAAFDYREKAPGKATRDMYLDKKGEPTDESIVGPKAAGIPGTVAGLALAHERLGSMPWAELVEPAARLAREGHTIDSFHAQDLERGAQRMRDAGFAKSAAYYSKPDGSPYAEGDTWQQEELANTLDRIAKQGPKAFYTGEVAKTMATEMQKAGGIWSEKVLASYQAVDRKPIEFEYRGHQVITMPPPSAGGVVLRQILAASEVLGLDEKPWRSVDEVHHYVEACRRTYADRNLLLGDPDFVELPMKRLLDTSYIAKRLANIDPKKATPSSEVGAGEGMPKESGDTTHYSVIDGQGNAVANTYTLNLGFGGRFVIPGVGVLVNNEMDDFAAKPGSPNAYGLVQGEQNAIEPGKSRPRWPRSSARWSTTA
jgi:gamma-glutamyltranspeptidase/glutathione hydrolase